MIEPNFKQNPTPELALKIYQNLQGYRGRAILSGFMNGEVISDDIPLRRFEVDTQYINDFSRKVFLERGFTEQDLESEILIMNEAEFSFPETPFSRFVKMPYLWNYNISCTGKAIRKRYDGKELKYQPVELGPRQNEALDIVADLSATPILIYEVFKTYDKFLEALGNNYDPTGIDKIDFLPQQILYHGGLKTFVKALHLKKVQLELTE